jgi:hypothetical protein
LEDAMYKIIVLDIDGVLIFNRFSRIFGGMETSSFFRRRPWLKRILLRVFEILESCVMFFGFRHKNNTQLMDFLCDVREHNRDLKFFILTDRSLLGVRNVLGTLKLLRLRKNDVVQISGDSGNLGLADIEDLSAKIFFCKALKPDKNTLVNLVKITNSKDSGKVLIINNNREFLRIAASFPFFFSTIPASFFHIENDETPQNIFLYFLQKSLRRR